jgi:hypothetical protein
MAIKTMVSQLTIISSALGVFFMSAAFYKSIFHKRRSPELLQNAGFRSNQPIRMVDPFQPVSDDVFAEAARVQAQEEVAYPEFSTDNEPTVSAFRKVTAGEGVDSVLAQSEAYAWE